MKPSRRKAANDQRKAEKHRPEGPPPMSKFAAKEARRRQRESEDHAD